MTLTIRCDKQRTRRDTWRGREIGFQPAAAFTEARSASMCPGRWDCHVWPVSERADNQAGTHSGSRQCKDTAGRRLFWTVYFILKTNGDKWSCSYTGEVDSDFGPFALETYSLSSCQVLCKHFKMIQAEKSSSTCLGSLTSPPAVMKQHENLWKRTAQYVMSHFLIFWKEVTALCLIRYIQKVTMHLLAK